MKRTSMFIPDWSAVIIKLKRGPTTRVEEKGDELLMKTTVKLAKGKSLFHFPENFLNNRWLKLWLSPKIYLMRLENAYNALPIIFELMETTEKLGKVYLMLLKISKNNGWQHYGCH